MSSPSTEARLLRFLLGIHLMLVVWSIVAVSQMWPHGYNDISHRVIAVVAVLVSESLLLTVGVSSSRLVSGRCLSRVHFGVHGLWIAIFLAFCAMGWGPLANRVSSRSFDAFEPRTGVFSVAGAFSVLVMVLFYSGVPMIVNRSASVIVAHQGARRAKLIGITSGLLFLSALAFLTVVRLGFARVSDEMVALFTIAPLTAGFLTAGLGAILGDRSAGGLLMWEAGALAVFQVVRF